MDSDSAEERTRAFFSARGWAAPTLTAPALEPESIPEEDDESEGELERHVREVNTVLQNAQTRLTLAREKKAVMGTAGAPPGPSGARGCCAICRPHRVLVPAELCRQARECPASVQHPHMVMSCIQ